MAVYRPTPSCPYCGKIIAEEIVDTESKLYGDNHIGWSYIDHTCRKMRKARKELYEKNKKEFDAIREEFAKISKGKGK
jgi:hypothetical protein